MPEFGRKMDFQIVQSPKLDFPFFILNQYKNLNYNTSGQSRGDFK